VPTFLVDKSALARRRTRAEVREALDPLLLEGEVATCGIVDLEMRGSPGRAGFNPTNCTPRTRRFAGI